MLAHSGFNRSNQTRSSQGQSSQSNGFGFAEKRDRSPFQILSFGRRSQSSHSQSSSPFEPKSADTGFQSIGPKSQAGHISTEFAYVKELNAPALNQYAVGELSATDTVHTPEGDRRWDEYTLPGLRKGQQVHVQLNSDTFDPYLQLVDANTGKIISTNDDGVDHNSRLTFKVKKGVNYKLHITSYSGDATGQYEVKTETFAPRKMKDFNFDYGHGLVDAAAAVAEAAGENLFKKKTSGWSSKGWGQDSLNVPQIWKKGLTGKNVTVAVVDTGININHPELKGNLWQNPNEIPGNGRDDDGNGFVDDVKGWNFADNNADVSDARDHGTHIAGIIAANKRGKMKGIAYDANIMPIKVVGESGGSQEQVAQGIRYAVENGADVINISLGADPGSAMDNQLKRAIRFAYRKGSMVVVASGNERQSLGATQPGEPAAYTAQSSLGLVVGATDPTHTVAAFSNPTGNRRSPFVVAPGTNIFSLSSQDPSGYKWRQGTSMATAHVSAVAALMLGANPNLKPRDMIKIISETADSQRVNEA